MARPDRWPARLLSLCLAFSAGGISTVLPGAVAMAQPAPTVATSSSLHVDAVDPTAASNPAGAPFPGFRGGNQLIVYTKPGHTGTNEFGFEVTVQQGRVVRRDGADSTVPPDGFVVSGHGTARAWILKYLPIGTNVTWQPGDTELKAEQDPAADVWRVRSLWGQIRQLDEKAAEGFSKRIDAVIQQAASSPVTAAATARNLMPALQQALWRAYKPLPAEARAVWYRPQEPNAAAVRETVSRMHTAGIHTIYLETLFHGYPIYVSEVYKKWKIPPQYPRFAGWDPLAEFVAAAKAEGMTVVPWVHTLYVGHDSLKPASPILEAHPDWANRQLSAVASKKPVASTVEGGAYFLDPVHPDVSHFLAEAMAELVRRYPVPAVQLDDTRYPMPFPEIHPDYLASTWGYTPRAISDFRRRYRQDLLALTPGTAPWSTWMAYRREHLTRLVATLATAMKQARSDVQVQMPFATNPQESYDRTLQDWPAWADRHLIDAFAVLNYTNSLAAVRQNIRYVYFATAGTIPLIGGVFGPFLAATPTETLAQASVARDEHADVIGLFSWSQVTPDLIQALRTGIFAPVEPGTGHPN